LVLQVAVVMAAAAGATTSVAVVAALITAMAALAVGLLNYVVQSRVLKQQRDQLERQLAIAREGQITERFTRAVEQLGNDKADVRVGGIYALEQIAKSSERESRAIVEVLTAYLQVHSPWPPILAGQPRNDTGLDDLPSLRSRAPDVQAAITVLGRRDAHGAGPEALNLANIDLRLAELRDADLQSAILRAGGFQRTIFHRANLTGAILARSELQKADLRDAKLETAMLRRAKCQGADFGGANLEKADLEYADLRGTILGGANLRGTIVTGADFRGATATSATVWPEGFDPAARGVVTRV
jgi:membrane protein implicated in regulation of membrane protease activity